MYEAQQSPHWFITVSWYLNNYERSFYGVEYYFLILRN